MLFKQLLHENQLRLDFLKLFLIHSVMKQGALQDTGRVRIPFTSVCMHTCKKVISVHVMFSKIAKPTFKHSFQCITQVSQPSTDL